jgi:hypothetical protein
VWQAPDTPFGGGRRKARLSGRHDSSEAAGSDSESDSDVSVNSSSQGEAELDDVTVLSGWVSDVDDGLNDSSVCGADGCGRGQSASSSPRSSRRSPCGDRRRRRDGRGRKACRKPGKSRVQRLRVISDATESETESDCDAGEAGSDADTDALPGLFGASMMLSTTCADTTGHSAAFDTSMALSASSSDELEDRSHDTMLKRLSGNTTLSRRTSGGDSVGAEVPAAAVPGRKRGSVMDEVPGTCVLRASTMVVAFAHYMAIRTAVADMLAPSGDSHRGPTAALSVPNGRGIGVAVAAPVSGGVAVQSTITARPVDDVAITDDALSPATQQPSQQTRRARRGRRIVTSPECESPPTAGCEPATVVVDDMTSAATSTTGPQARSLSPLFEAVPAVTAATGRVHSVITLSDSDSDDDAVARGPSQAAVVDEYESDVENRPPPRAVPVRSFGDELPTRRGRVRRGDVTALTGTAAGKKGTSSSRGPNQSRRRRDKRVVLTDSESGSDDDRGSASVAVISGGVCVPTTTTVATTTTTTSRAAGVDEARPRTRRSRSAKENSCNGSDPEAVTVDGNAVSLEGARARVGGRGAKGPGVSEHDALLATGDARRRVCVQHAHAVAKAGFVCQSCQCSLTSSERARYNGLLATGLAQRDTPQGVAALMDAVSLCSDDVRLHRLIIRSFKRVSAVA